MIARLMSELKAPTPSRKLSETLDEVVACRVEFLAGYQSALREALQGEGGARARSGGASPCPAAALTDAVARSLFKLMAYKDEYEVARHRRAFEKQIASTFEGENLRLEFHLAPPLLARKDPVTGLPRKMSFGPWMMKAFRALSKFKACAARPLDPFGYSHERMTERSSARSDGSTRSYRSSRPMNHATAWASPHPAEDPRFRPYQGAISRPPGRRRNSFSSGSGNLHRSRPWPSRRSRAVGKGTDRLRAPAPSSRPRGRAETPVGSAFTSLKPAAA